MHAGVQQFGFRKPAASCHLVTTESRASELVRSGHRFAVTAVPALCSSARPSAGWAAARAGLEGKGANMQTRLAPEAFPAEAARPAPAGLPDPALTEELLFLEAWARGLISWAGAMLRIRQIRRANPVLAAAVYSQLARPYQGTDNTGATPAGRTELLAAEARDATNALRVRRGNREKRRDCSLEHWPTPIRGERTWQ